MKFSIKDFFSKCDQIRRKYRSFAFRDQIFPTKQLEQTKAFKLVITVLRYYKSLSLSKQIKTR